MGRFASTVIYGPPGCGKTTDLVNRLSEAVEIWGGSKVLFLSFTKAAVGPARAAGGSVARSIDGENTIVSVSGERGSWVSVAMCSTTNEQTGSPRRRQLGSSMRIVSP